MFTPKPCLSSKFKWEIDKEFWVDHPCVTSQLDKVNVLRLRTTISQALCFDIKGCNERSELKSLFCSLEMLDVDLSQCTLCPPEEIDLFKLEETLARTCEKMQKASYFYCHANVLIKNKNCNDT